jgi:hypothetical protein
VRRRNESRCSVIQGETRAGSCREPVFRARRHCISCRVECAPHASSSDQCARCEPGGGRDRSVGHRNRRDAIYGLRLFGIRTILIGADLFRLHGRDLDRALKAAPIIHASDTATVLALQRNKQLSPERARPLVLISGLNTVLAVIAYLTARRSRS